MSPSSAAALTNSAYQALSGTSLKGLAEAPPTCLKKLTAILVNSALVMLALGRKLPSSYPSRIPARVRVETALLYQAPEATSVKPLDWLQ